MRLFEQEKSTQNARQPLATISSNNQDTSCYLCRVVRACSVGRWSRPTLVLLTRTCLARRPPPEGSLGGIRTDRLRLNSPGAAPSGFAHRQAKSALPLPHRAARIKAEFASSHAPPSRLRPELLTTKPPGAASHQSHLRPDPQRPTRTAVVNLDRTDENASV